jgi:hypothetical protein
MLDRMHGNLDLSIALDIKTEFIAFLESHGVEEVFIDVWLPYTEPTLLELNWRSRTT